MVYPAFARGALALLGGLQAKERDDFRDAEPGKIPHELRYGELAHFKVIPHTPYYGTADATPLYLTTLHAAWRATGDRTLLDSIWPRRRRASTGSIAGGTATVTGFKSTRRVHRSATRTWPGRTRRTACCILTARR